MHRYVESRTQVRVFFHSNNFVTQVFQYGLSSSGPSPIGIVCQRKKEGKKKWRRAITRRAIRGWKFIWQFDVATRWEQYNTVYTPPLPIEMILMIVPRIDNGLHY